MISILSRTPDVVRRLARSQPNTLVRYAGTVLVIMLCAALRVQLPFTALPYLFFIPGLMFIGFCFGVGPSTLGCVLAVLTAHYFFIGEIGFNDGWTAWLSSASFALVTLVMAVVCALFRKTLNALSDVNDRLEHEVERRTLERDGIWNVSPDLICTLSDTGTVVAMNPAWQTETGHTHQALKGGAFFSFISPSQLSDALRDLSSGPIAELDTQGVRANGQPLHLNWRIARRQGLYFAVARDITLYKERQEALDQVRSQLQQSQKMEAVGQLTGGLAHDFNNLLTVITGSLDMLEQLIAQEGRKDLTRYVGLARNASGRAASLTHRLLAYARRQPLASSVVDLGLLVHDMEELISRTLTPRIELTLLTPEEAVLCYCDAHQLENAIVNLCINARDAMPQGGRLQIEISRTLQEDAANPETGPFARVRVSDTGTGMPQSVLERAFDPFFTTKPLGSGTGLGLSMVYGFAQQSAGGARIESVMGEGTTVSLLLPLHDGPATPSGVGPATFDPDDGQANDAALLIVDDEVAIRDLVGESLEGIGYRVTKVGTAAQALRALESEPQTRLLITDVGLPGSMSGDELAVAALALRPSLKVLFISGFVENVIPAIALKSGQTELLLKPFAVNELNATVHRLLAPR
ncbi:MULTISPECIES: ATP-binding protein [unclassified Pseudomonas]|uniref:ATP-binding protein n=1 Tax=unclassified Pseudomonas TaxID=196821 RepID=UPI000D3BA9BF|nr:MULTISPECIES: ATP-binding protein [unclassified Pseudomonas]RAU45724.1 response regulator [Pseudomonas sp. RIT 409]RAU56178.1 response regulator [Pseudomonas sp. RIT 412]